jgi:hypothetical protein
MAALTQQQREQLRNDLLQMSYRAAKVRVRNMDPNSRLRYWRNSQRAGELHTTYDLPGFNTRVTLVETIDPTPKPDKSTFKPNYTYIDARVEPLN